MPENRGGNGMSQSQLEKFQARESKRLADERAINEAKARKARSADELNNVEEFKEKGNIKEAAAVISYEGLQMFSKMFTNSIEESVDNAISSRVDVLINAIESRVDAILTARLTEVLEGVSEGISKFSDTAVTQLVESKIAKHPAMTDLSNLVDFKKPDPILFDTEEDEPTQDIPKNRNFQKAKIAIPDELEVPEHGKLLFEEVDPETRRQLLEKFVGDAFEPDEDEPEEPEYRTPDYSKNPVELDNNGEEVLKVEVPAQEVKTEPFTGEVKLLGLSKDEVLEVAPMVAAFMKENGLTKPVQVANYLLEFEGLKVKNPTALFQQISRHYPNIQKVGYGVYEYEEKTFKPVN